MLNYGWHYNISKNLKYVVLSSLDADIVGPSLTRVLGPNFWFKSGFVPQEKNTFPDSG